MFRGTKTRSSEFLATVTVLNFELKQVECDRQTRGRQVGEVREHECNMHVCVGVGGHNEANSW